MLILEARVTKYVFTLLTELCTQLKVAVNAEFQFD
jgi:hypothetical protein